MGKDADINDQNRIDAAATLLFDNLLPADWQKFSITPDVYCDYVWEPRLDGALTGEKVFVQQKGVRRAKVSSGHVHYGRLETKHVRYWADKCRMPVFLFVADLRTKTGYWLFVQQHVLERLPSGWRQKATVTVHIPVDQRVDDIGGLATAIADAHRYMANVRPGAIQAAVLARKAQIESIDPRFTASIAVNHQGHSQVTLHAKEDVTLDFTFRGSPKVISSLFSDLLGKGLPVEVTPEIVTVTGSPLFQEMFSTPLTLHAARSIPVELRTVILDAVGQPAEVVQFTWAVVEGGTEEQRLDASLGDGLIRLGGVLFQSGRRLTLGHSLGGKSWVGTPILLLPYFDQMRAFFVAMQRGHGIRLECHWQGNAVFSATMRESTDEDWTDHIHLLDLVGKARVVARRLGVNPPLPERLTYGDAKAVERLHDIVTHGSRPAAGVRITSVATVRRLGGVYQLPPDLPGPTTVLTRLHRQSDDLFGAEVWVPPTDVQLTDALVTIEDLADGRTSAADGEVNVRMVLTGTETSVYTVQSSEETGAAPDGSPIVISTP